MGMEKNLYTKGLKGLKEFMNNLIGTKQKTHNYTTSSILLSTTEHSFNMTLAGACLLLKILQKSHRVRMYNLLFQTPPSKVVISRG